MLFMGIDPGLGGAMAVINACGNLVQVIDTPTLQVGGKTKTKRVLNISVMVEEMLPFLKQSAVTAALENVHSLPHEGVSSAFSFGRGLGVWEGILAALCIPVTMVAPQTWKKAMMQGMGKEKDASRLRALQIYPTAKLSLKKHHNRADAILIARWLWKEYQCSNPSKLPISNNMPSCPSSSIQELLPSLEKPEGVSHPFYGH